MKNSTARKLKQLVALINKELLETSTRCEKQLLQTEKQLTQTSNKLTKLYMALESGKLDLEDLAPRIKELRIHQQEMQKQRDHLLSSVNSEASESLDTDTVIGYVKELEQILGEAPFLQRKTFIRSFVKRVEVNPKKVVVDYTIPLPLETKRTSTREVLYTDRIGSGGRIRTHDLRVMGSTG